MRRWASFLAILSLAILVAGMAAAAGTGAVRVLVQAPPGQRAALAVEYGLRWDFGPRGFTTDVTPAGLERLRSAGVPVTLVPVYSIQDRLISAKPVKTATRTVPSDPTPWGIETIYNDPSITKTTGGAGINVAVLDTGVYTKHPDLTRRVVQCLDFTKVTVPASGCADQNGHGTHVSGTILADGGADGLGIWGVAPQASLFAYKVLGASGSGYADDIAAAIRYAADHGANIISMSLGSSVDDPLMRDAVTYAVGKNVLVVAAAGNSGPNLDTMVYPGANQDVIGVAAIDATLRVADFSSRGINNGDGVITEREVEVAAPGVSVESTYKDGGYAVYSGTSMATPHISGLAARIWSFNPGWTASQVRAEIDRRATWHDITSGIYAGVGDDPASGLGLPQVINGQ